MKLLSLAHVRPLSLQRLLQRTLPPHILNVAETLKVLKSLLEIFDSPPQCILHGYNKNLFGIAVNKLSARDIAVILHALGLDKTTERLHTDKFVGELYDRVDLLASELAIEELTAFLRTSSEVTLPMPWVLLQKCRSRYCELIHTMDAAQVANALSVVKQDRFSYDHGFFRILLSRAQKLLSSSDPNALAELFVVMDMVHGTEYADYQHVLNSLAETLSNCEATGFSCSRIPHILSMVGRMKLSLRKTTAKFFHDAMMRLVPLNERSVQCVPPYMESFCVLNVGQREMFDREGHQVLLDSCIPCLACLSIPRLCELLRGANVLKLHRTKALCDPVRNMILQNLESCSVRNARDLLHSTRGLLLGNPEVYNALLRHIHKNIEDAPSSTLTIALQVMLRSAICDPVLAHDFIAKILGNAKAEPDGVLDNHNLVQLVRYCVGDKFPKKHAEFGKAILHQVENRLELSKANETCDLSIEDIILLTQFVYRNKHEQEKRKNLIYSQLWIRLPGLLRNSLLDFSEDHATLMQIMASSRVINIDAWSELSYSFERSLPRTSIETITVFLNARTRRKSDPLSREITLLVYERLLSLKSLYFSPGQIAMILSFMSQSVRYNEEIKDVLCSKFSNCGPWSLHSACSVLNSLTVLMCLEPSVTNFLTKRIKEGLRSREMTNIVDITTTLRAFSVLPTISPDILELLYTVAEEKLIPKPDSQSPVIPSGPVLNMLLRALGDLQCHRTTLLDVVYKHVEDTLSRAWVLHLASDWLYCMCKTAYVPRRDTLRHIARSSWENHTGIVTDQGVLLNWAIAMGPLGLLQSIALRKRILSHVEANATLLTATKVTQLVDVFATDHWMQYIKGGEPCESLQQVLFVLARRTKMVLKNVKYSTKDLWKLFRSYTKLSLEGNIFDTVTREIAEQLSHHTLTEEQAAELVAFSESSKVEGKVNSTSPGLDRIRQVKLSNPDINE